MTLQDLTPVSSVNPLGFSERFLDHCVENMHNATRHQANQHVLNPLYYAGDGKVLSFPINETHILQIYRNSSDNCRARFLIIDTGANTLSVAGDTQIFTSGSADPYYFSCNPDNPNQVLIFYSGKTVLFTADPDTDTVNFSIDSTNNPTIAASSLWLNVAWQGNDVAVISPYDDATDLRAEVLLFNISGTTLTYHSTSTQLVEAGVTVSGSGRASDCSFDEDAAAWIYAVVSDDFTVMVEFTFTSTSVAFVDDGYSAAVKYAGELGAIIRVKGRTRSVRYASSSTLGVITFRLHSGSVDAMASFSEGNLGGLAADPLSYTKSVKHLGHVLVNESKRDPIRGGALSSQILEVRHAQGVHGIEVAAQPSYSMLHLCFNSTYSHLVVMHGYQSGTTFYFHHDLYAGPGALED